MNDQWASPADADTEPARPMISRENPFKSQGSLTVPIEWADASAFVVGLIPTDVFRITQSDRWSVSLIRRAAIVALEHHVEVRFLAYAPGWTKIEIDNTSFRMATGTNTGEEEETVRALLAAIVERLDPAVLGLTSRTRRQDYRRSQ